MKLDFYPKPHRFSIEDSGVTITDYVMVVDLDHMEEFRNYLSIENQEVVEWLDER